MNSDSPHFPFYFLPMDQKRSVQIIKENKAEIKKMESLRPSTPFNKRNFQHKSQIEVQAISRPSSSASIKSLRYEAEEKFHASNRVLFPIKSHKGVTNNIDIKLEPIVTKPALCPRKSSNTRLRHKSESEFSGFPPLPCEEDKSNKVITNKTAEECEGHIEELKPLEENLTALDQNYNFINESFNNLSFEGMSQTESENSTVSTKQDNENEIEKEFDKLSEDLSVFLPVLEKSIKLGKKKELEETVATVCEIHHLLREKNAFSAMFINRIHLLKLLFKLLDSNSPDLSISIIKILLDMKVKDNNLSNVFRLILKLMKDECFNKCDHQLINALFENIQEISVANNRAATTYGIKILKQLVQTGHLQEELMEKCIAAVNYHLSEFMYFFCFKHDWDPSFNHMIIQVLSILHYLIDNESTRKLLTKGDSVIQILKMLHSFYKHIDIVEITVRLISKLIDKEGCEALTNCPDDLLFNFVHVLEFHKYHIDITLQMTFIVGNLISADGKKAYMFMSSPDFIKTVVDVLDDYVQEHIQFKENISDRFKNESCGDRNWHYEIFEVILKVLCIWANICLSQKAGSFLATQHSLILHLLSIIADYREQSAHYDTSFALYSFLVVMGNISYYFQSGSIMCVTVTERVIPFLDASFSKEVRLESANIVRNLTRHQEVREYAQEHSLLPKFMKLLNEDDKEFNTAAYGIVMNLLIDQRTHKIFYQEQGITKVLHKLHFCAERDWKTSAMMCQILWNYCCGENFIEAPISKIEVQHLEKFLSYSVYKASKRFENEKDCYEEWKNEFCPVAKKLLELLQGRNSNKL